MPIVNAIIFKEYMLLLVNYLMPLFEESQCCTSNVTKPCPKLNSTSTKITLHKKLHGGGERGGGGGGGGSTKITLHNEAKEGPTNK